MAAEPLVQLKKTNRRGPGKKQKLEVDVSQSLKETFLQSKALSGALRVAPDLFILGGGFYLGYVMNMRPGIDVPLIPGGFIGFPDFGSKVKELQFSVDSAKRKLAEALKREEEDVATLSECQQRCQEAFDRGEINTTQLGSCIAACGARKEAQKDLIERLQARLAELGPQLMKHKVAQGVLMSTLIYAFTRPGFLQGIGEIIPG